MRFLLLFLLPLSLSSQTLPQDLETIAQDNNLIGISVVTVCGDEVLDVFHYGKANLATNQDVSDQTYYRIASISKSVTAVALMKLYEEGLFDLDDDISGYLGYTVQNPNHPGIAITFRMLLSHTSSLQDGSGYGNFLSATYNLSPVPPISELLIPGGDYYTGNLWRVQAPGTYFKYSNLNYGVIGTLVEKISGQRFDLFVRDSILLPLNISGSFNVDHIPDINNVAVLYRNAVPQADNYLGNPPPPFDPDTYTIGDNGLLFGPQGSLRITAPDLSKFLRMVSGNGSGVLDSATLALLFVPQWTYNGSNGDNYYNLFNQWGLGFHLTTNAPQGDIVIPGIEMAGHPGEAYGLISDMYFEPLNRFGVIFITNGYYGTSNYDIGANSAFYVPEEEAFSAVATHSFVSCPLEVNATESSLPEYEGYYDPSSHSWVFRGNIPEGPVRIFNLAGIQVWEADRAAARIPLPDLASGMYFLSAGEGLCWKFWGR